MKLLLSLLILLTAFSTQANSLWKENDIYFLGEYLHGARYDYEESIYVKFKEDASLIQNDIPSNPGKYQCSEIESLDLMAIFEESVNSYLAVFPEEEFDFYHALELLNDKLDSSSPLYKCLNQEGLSIILDKEGKFLLSYKKL